MKYFASLMDRPKTGQFGVNLTKTPEWFEVAIRLRTDCRRLVQWSNAVGLRPLPDMFGIIVAQVFWRRLF
jgi:hypothetical protein